MNVFHTSCLLSTLFLTKKSFSHFRWKLVPYAPSLQKYSTPSKVQIPEGRCAPASNPETFRLCALRTRCASARDDVDTPAMQLTTHA